MQLPQVSSTALANLELHHGDLQTVRGVHSYQVVRANRAADGVENWTYNHAPMLAWWNGRFYLQYLSNPVSEHLAPGRTLLTSSADGRSWDPPGILFDQYPVKGGNYPGVDPELTRQDTTAVMHQRMGFYVASDGRLLTLGFYGFSPTLVLPPFDRLGIGRVVREIYRDGSWGPAFFIHLNEHAGWNRSNTSLAWYTESDDNGFVTACEELLENRLVVQQWTEEHGAADPRIKLKGRYKALSYYTLSDGRVVGLWKWSRAGITADGGETWNPVGETPSIETAGGKIWGQRTSDNRFVLLYTPTMNNQHRWPLALTTSADGLNFGDLYAVCGDVLPRRYHGSHKDFGLNYVRGIAEGNGTPPGDDVWVAYSMNKEDIWITRIAVPIRTTVDGHVDDDFSIMDAAEFSRKWTTLNPRHAPITLESFLCIRDGDPWDYARAERHFPESHAITVDLEFSLPDPKDGQLFVELLDPRGRVAVRLLKDGDGMLKVHHSRGTTILIPCEMNKNIHVRTVVDTALHRFTIVANGRQMGSGQVYNGESWTQPSWYFLNSVRSLSRLVLRTKPIRREPTPDTPLEPGEDLPETPPLQRVATFHIHRIRTSSPTSEELLL